MQKLVPGVGENRNVWLCVIFISWVALISLFGVGCGSLASHLSTPQIHQVGWQGTMNNLNQEVRLFFPQNDQTRLFGSERKFTDPFDQTVTDVFTPTVTAIEDQTHKITLRVVVKLPSGSYTMTVPDISNNKTALYLSIPNRQGILKTSHIPFCYVWGIKWGSGNLSAAIDYTASDQITWV